MTWCHQATSHYLSQCWPRSMSPCGVTRPQWVNLFTSEFGYINLFKIWNRNAANKVPFFKALVGVLFLLKYQHSLQVHVPVNKINTCIKTLLFSSSFMAGVTRQHLLGDRISKNKQHIKWTNFHHKKLQSTPNQGNTRCSWVMKLTWKWSTYYAVPSDRMMLQLTT